MEKLEFSANNLYYSTIEDKITNFYNLGYASSSNFTELEVGVGKIYYIMATSGSIEFSSIVGRTIDGNYLITIIPRKIKMNK